jgi:hypothetical protein
VKCVNQGDPAHPRVEVDYQVFVRHPMGGTHAERLASACSMDISQLPAWCLIWSSLAGVTEVRLKSPHGTWFVPIPNHLSAQELCFGPKAEQQ